MSVQEQHVACLPGGASELFLVCLASKYRKFTE